MKQQILFAFVMAIITGSMTVTIAILHSGAPLHDFWKLWFHTVPVVYPTIMFSILVVSPHVRRLISRLPI